MSEQVAKPELREPWQTLLSLIALSFAIGLAVGLVAFIGSMVLAPSYVGDSNYPPIVFRLGLDTFLLGLPGIVVIVAAANATDFVLKQWGDVFKGRDWLTFPVIVIVFSTVLAGGFWILKAGWRLLT